MFRDVDVVGETVDVVTGNKTQIHFDFFSGSMQMPKLEFQEVPDPPVQMNAATFTDTVVRWFYRLLGRGSKKSMSDIPLA